MKGGEWGKEVGKTMTMNVKQQVTESKEEELLQTPKHHQQTSKADFGD